MRKVKEAPPNPKELPAGRQRENPGQAATPTNGGRRAKLSHVLRDPQPAGLSLRALRAQDSAARKQKAKREEGRDRAGLDRAAAVRYRGLRPAAEEGLTVSHD